MNKGYLDNVSFLVVDDNTFMRTIVRRVLAQFGAHQIREASDGADAMELLLSFRPDIIILDWVMEPVDGLEFMRWLRKGEDSPDIFLPVILMTAHSEASHVVEGRDAGVNEILVKPISAKSLINRIKMIIEKPRPFVKTHTYFGPDRRRRQIKFRGPERRTDYEAYLKDETETL